MIKNYFKTACRTTIVLSGLSMLLFALIALSIQTIKAARANPVKSWRTE